MARKTIEQWKLDVLTVLGEKQAKIDSTPTPTLDDSPLDKNLRDISEILPEVTMPGSPPPTGKVGRFLAKQLFGSREDRHKIDPKKQQLIEDMHKDGTACPVKIEANGRQLKGNFFSAKGHNLKEKDFVPDLDTPVVLLLTGSGGSSQDQGLDVSKFYAENGANVLSVNFGGYGDSDDIQVSEKSLNEDAQAMVEHLVKMGYDPDKIIIHGYSMGGSVAAQLQSQYEKKGIKFRGQVQDRPMPSTHDGVVGHLGNTMGSLPSEIAKGKLGRMSGKKALLDTDGTTRTVVGTDSSGNFGLKGDRMREQLKDEHGEDMVSGSKSEGGHFDHEKALEANRDPLLDLVRVGREGEISPKSVTAPETLELQLMLEEACNDVKNSYSQLTLEMGGALKAEDVESMKSAMDSAFELQEKIAQLQSTGLEKLERCKPEMVKLEAYQRGADTCVQKLRDGLKAAGADDPFVEETLIRLANPIAVLTARFESAGGPSEENIKLEEDVLKMAVRVKALIKDLSNESEFRKEQGDLFFQIELLDDWVEDIVESRTEREHELKEAKQGLTKLANRETGSQLKKAQDQLKQELQQDFDKLKAEGEDVSRKKFIGRSKDKGYLKAVVRPVESILPKIENLMKRGKKIDNETLPELDQVFTGLNDALRLYTQKRDETNQKKHPKAYEQRDAKVKAIQSRLEALAGLIDKANNQAEKIKEKLDEQKPKSLLALEESGGIETAKTVVGSLFDKLNQDTGDEEQDQQAHETARDDAKLVGKYLSNCDEFQREAILRSGLPPEGLALVQSQITGQLDDEIAEILFDEFGDDEQYLEQLITIGIQDAFATVDSGTKPLRSNTLITKLAKKVGESAGGLAFCNNVVGETLEEAKGKKLDIRPPFAPGEDATQEEREQYENELQQVQENVQQHIAMFRKFFANLIKQEIPPAISKTCATLYEAALAKYGDETDARRYVGGHVLLRFVNPALTSMVDKNDPGAQQVTVIQGKLMQSLANNVSISDPTMKPFEDLMVELRQKMDDYLMYAVNAGRAAKDGDGPRDFAFEALTSDTLTNAAFVDPTEPDPLGTLPAEPKSVLGHAIANARLQRSTDYDWEDIVSFRENDPQGLARVVLSERKEVLQLISS